jgi:thiamine pyrophosphate-dependent acetolactate synthase large subunit-like protein
MKRIDAIGKIFSEITDELVVCSCGMISREAYMVNDRSKNFYVMGSMGASLGIGIGLALTRPEMKVIVIAGDGEVLMSLGTLVLMNKLKLRNLKLFILDNNCYSSTGGQKTCSDAVDFSKIAKCNVIKVESGKGDAPRIDISHEEITKRFYNAINKK